MCCLFAGSVGARGCGFSQPAGFVFGETRREATRHEGASNEVLQRSGWLSMAQSARQNKSHWKNTIQNKTYYSLGKLRVVARFFLSERMVVLIDTYKNRCSTVFPSKPGDLKAFDFGGLLCCSL